MAYIGRNPAVGTQRTLDSLESQFNDSLTTFNLRYNGNPIYPTISESLIVSLGGVLQEPGEAYYVSSDQIVFSQAPSAGLDCWILLYSEYGAAAGGSSSGGAVSVATGEPMGHEDKTHSSISFDDSTRTFTIAPNTGGGYSDFVVWTKGTKRTYTSAQTVQIGTATGLYYIYFDPFGVLQYRTTYFVWDADTPTAYVYWNATTSTGVFVADERHGIVLDWQTHEYLHRTRGAVIASGFGISNYVTTGDGSADSHAQFDLANGTFFDEDLEVGITHSATPSAGTFTQVLQGNAEIPVYYMSGSSGDWVKDSATEFACKQSATTLQYNSLSGATWGTTAADDNRYVISWVVATNEINAPVIAILGQQQYSSIGEAEAEVFGDLTLTNFPIFEFRPLWKVIFRTNSNFTNTPNAFIANVLDLREFSSTGVAGTIVNDHGLLSGLTDDDHSQYLNTTISRTGVTANISTTGNLGGANLVLTGQLQGPSNFVIDPAVVGDDTGTVEIKGNLTVQGTTTTINSTTVDLDHLSLGDNEIANFGDGNDLKIYHDATNNYIESVNGDLIIKNSTSDYLKGIASTGSVEIKYNGDNRLQTANDGIVLANDLSIRVSDSSKSLSIQGGGTTYPGGKITLKGGNNSAPGIFMYTGGTTATPEERVRIDSDGDIRLYESGANGNSRELSFEVYGGTAANGGHGIINFKRSRSFAADTQLATTNDILGQIKFSGSDGSAFAEGARIEAQAFGTWSGSDRATSLIFHVTPDNSTILTEALRIKYDGNVGIGTDNPTEKLHLYDNYVLTSNTSTRKIGIYNKVERQTSSDSYSAFSIYGTYNSYSQIPPLNASASITAVNGTRNDVAIYTGSVTGAVYGTYNYTRLGLFSGGSGVSVGDVVSVYNDLSTGIQTNTITNAYGIKNIVTINTNSTITNSYGIHLSKAGAGVITNNWSIYSSDGTSKMYHEGNVGIGSTDPQAKLDVAGNVQPSADATHNLGSPTFRWANIYSADLQLSNEGSANDVDGTWGAYTIQEGEEELYLINRRSGKKFKFVLEEVN